MYSVGSESTNKLLSTNVPKNFPSLLVLITIKKTKNEKKNKMKKSRIRKEKESEATIKRERIEWKGTRETFFLRQFILIIPLM